MDLDVGPAVQLGNYHFYYHQSNIMNIIISIPVQGGRTWQPFVGGKNGHENFRQARFYNFCDKCVVFARIRKFANLTQ